MRVIMLSSFKSVGKSGEIVNVKPGYAKNYLVRFGIAKYATKAEVANMEKNMELVAMEDEKMARSSEKLKEALDGSYIVIVRAAGDDGRLYGSVRTLDVLDFINKKIQEIGSDIVVRRSDIDMGNGIKEIGIHECGISLHGNTRASVKLNVARSVADAQAAQKASESGELVNKKAASISSVLKNVKMEPQVRRESRGSEFVPVANQEEVEAVAGGGENPEGDKIAGGTSEIMNEQALGKLEKEEQLPASAE